MNRIEEALQKVGKAAFEAGIQRRAVRPGELVQIVVREEKLGGFDPLRRSWLKEKASEQLEVGRRSRNGQ